MPGFNFIDPQESKGMATPKRFFIHDYSMNRGTQSSDHGIVSNLDDPLLTVTDQTVKDKPQDLDFLGPKNSFQTFIITTVKHKIVSCTTNKS